MHGHDLAFKGIRLRLANESDADFLYNLFCDVRGGEIKVPGLEPSIADNLLAMQYRAQSASYGARFPSADRFIIEYISTPIGQLLINGNDSGPMHLVDISLLSDWRRRGIGTAILRALQFTVADRSTILQLMVARSNPALSLYQRLNFTETNHDDVYVSMTWGPSNPR